MFGWLTPKCPVELERKAWIEFRMRWLADQLGIERMRNAQVITPTTEYFPGPYHGTLDEIRKLMDRLAGMMGVTTEIKLTVGAGLTGASGLYVPGLPPTIVVSASIVNDPYEVAATLIHELAHEVLLGGGLLSQEDSDHEYVTDLLLIFLGIGIIPANNTIKDRSSREGQMEYFQIRKSGYLSAVDFGYAFALFAYARREDWPPWMHYLRPDARSAMKKGLKFLNKTGDTLFHPDKLGDKLHPPTAVEVCDSLRDGSPTEQIVKLWQLQDPLMSEPSVFEAIESKLGDRIAAIAICAAETLGRLRGAAARSVPPLIQALNDNRPRVRIAIVNALGQIAAQPDVVLQALIMQLYDPDRDVATRAANALGLYGEVAKPCLPDLLTALDKAYREHSSVESQLILALSKIDQNPKQRILDFYKDGDGAKRKHFVKMIDYVRQVHKE